MYKQKLFNLVLIVAFILTSLPLTVLAAPPAPASVDLSRGDQSSTSSARRQPTQSAAFPVSRLP